MGPRGSSLLSCLLLAVAPLDAAMAQATAVGRLPPFDSVTAEAILRDRLPCLGCHTLGTEGGRLAPDLATVRARRDAPYVARIVRDPQATVPGTFMPHTPMPERWRVLIIRYLGGDAASSPEQTRTSEVRAPDAPRPVREEALMPVTAVDDTSGARLYARFCTGCHGARGGGDGPNARSLPVPPARHASREAMAARSDDALYDTIAGGGAIMNRSPRMPAYGTTLTPPQIRALVRHIRSLCSCTGPAWSTDGGPAHE